MIGLLDFFGSNDEEQDEEQNEEGNENSDQKDENNDAEGKQKNQKEKTSSDTISQLREEIVELYLKRLDKKNFLKSIFRDEDMQSSAVEYILSGPQEAQEDENIDFSGFNIDPKFQEFLKILKNSNSGFLPAFSKKFLGFDFGYDEEKELKPMQELMNKEEYKTDEAKLKELKEAIKKGVPIQKLLTASAVVASSISSSSGNFSGKGGESLPESSKESQSSPVPPLNSSEVTLTSGFGLRKDPITGKENVQHNGVDLAASEGTPISAVVGGEIIEKGFEKKGFGNYLIIKGTDGKKYLYAHMQYPSSLNEGETVVAGQEIGKIGSTGKSTGPHLHFAIKENDKYIDPVQEFPDIFQDYKVA